jgi:HK97 gp10 family phage protein
VTNRVRIYDDRLLDFAAGEVGEVVDAALEGGESMAHHLVPVDTGNLDDHIDVIEWAHRDGGAVVGTYGVTDGDAEYWDDVEFGTMNAPAQPYLRPSIDGARQAIR